MKAIVTALAVALPTAAAAQQYDTTPLFQHGAWLVEHTYDNADGSTWCSADTGNSAGQTFSMTAYDDGKVAVLVIDPRWSAAQRPIRFRIDIDYNRWTIDGNANGPAASVMLSDDGDAAQFVTELAQGSAVAVYNDAGTRLAAFSLQGSAAAITALGECWARILQRDPFMNAADPF